MLMAGCSCLLGFTACDDDDDVMQETSLSMPAVDSENNNVVSSTIAMPDGVRYMGYGFCYSKDADPTIHDATVTATLEGNKLTATLEGLDNNCIYYVRAYATIYPSGVVYSQQLELAIGTPPTDPSELESYVAPAYPDYYVEIAGWDKRSQWNLSNVHDPTVVLAEDGYYYMYQTDASYGNAHTAGGHFHGRRSKNLVDWEYLGGTMQTLPDWVIPKLNEIRAGMGLGATTATGDFGFWAPCVRKVKDGLYRMYYSIVCPGTLDGDGTWGERAFIGLMENTDPANNDGWVDKGYVITNASDKGLDFRIAPDDWANCYYKWNAIDPSYLIDNDGRHYLVYGSWHSGIAVVELDPETGKVKEELPVPWGTDADIAPYGKLIATRAMGNRWQGSEGAEVICRNGHYYMFIAYDALDVSYNTRVARADNIEGPYYGIDGTDVTTSGGEILPVVTHPYKFSNSDGWVGISHCCVFDDGQGNWYFSSQGRLPAGVQGNPNSNALMMGQVRSIRWTDDDWPVVMPERYGAVPQIPIAEEELAGKWEIIDLSYSYGNQKTSTEMTLAADHTVSGGAWDKDQWSYDAGRQVLTVNGNAFFLQREADWEASPRTHTIVFAGIGSDNVTYWGKKDK